MLGVDERAHSIAGFIEGLGIFAQYLPRGINQKFFCNAEHDELSFMVYTDSLPPDSTDGKRLVALGFHPSRNGYWAYFT